MPDILFYFWVGEFGYEVPAAAIARKRSRQFKRTVVCSRPASAALYADFADEFIGHDLACVGDCEYTTVGTRPTADQLAKWMPKSTEATVLRPRAYSRGMVAEFIRYGHARPEFAGAVVIHIRERKDLAPERNWPTDSWALLVSSIARLGFASRIIAVGTRSASGIIPGVEDYRGAPLQDQMDILASAKFAVGTSSGPMHLASFCGCPHVVWLGGPKDERRFTGDRYMELWNPFKTPVIVLDQWDWQAPVEAVLDAVARIGERK